MGKSCEEIGREVGEEVKVETIAMMNQSGISLKKSLLRLKQAMNAKEKKAQFDPRAGEWVYSDPMVAHSIRLQATKMALEIHDVFPSKRHEISGPDGGPIPIDDRLNLALRQRAKITGEENDG